MKSQKNRSPDRYCAIVEAVLFSTPKPLSVAEIAKISRINPDHIPHALELIEIRYQDAAHGIVLSRLGGNYKLSVKHDLARRVAGLTKSELSRGLLRVLSLIAYNQPVSQSDIVKIIGNRTYEYVKELEKLGFVTSERKGKTKALSTTKAFAVYFETSPRKLREEMEKLRGETAEKGEKQKGGENEG